MNEAQTNSSTIGVKPVFLGARKVKKVRIGVLPVLSKKIAVKRHNGYYYILYGLAALFAACWLMAFCDLIGII